MFAPTNEGIVNVSPADSKRERANGGLVRLDTIEINGRGTGQWCGLDIDESVPSKSATTLFHLPLVSGT